MLIPKNINPDDCIYYNATFVLKVLIEHGQLSTSELFYNVNQLCKMTRISSLRFASTGSI